MFTNLKKPLLAMVISCLVLALSSNTVSGTYKGDYSDSYINFIDLSFENNAFNPSEVFSSIDKQFKSKMKLLHVNFIEFSYDDFIHLIGTRSSQDLKNYQKNYQKLIESEKEKIIQFIELEVDEDKESEKIHREMEEDITDFLKDLLSDK